MVTRIASIVVHSGIRSRSGKVGVDCSSRHSGAPLPLAFSALEVMLKLSFVPKG